MTDVSKFNNQSLGEEISNAISHGVGALLAVAGTVLIIIRAALYSGAIGVVSACIYGASLIILYTFSTLYHSLTNKTAKRVFQIFDHCSIFLLILGSYTPISLSLIGGASGWVLFGVNALCTVIGIILNCINLKRWHKLSLALYVIMGWSIVMGGKSVLTLMPRPGLILLLLGGIAYTAGIVFYKSTKYKFMHFIWHLFVLCGSILHFFSFFFYCFPK